MKEIIIIGGGAAGLAAAITAGRAAQGKDITVYLIERNDRVGKKLLATGNGRCNLSNTNINPRFYHSQTPDIAAEIIKDSKPLVENFFKSVGLYLAEEDGRLYPYSRLASSVLDMLRLAASACGVKTITGKRVEPYDFLNYLKTSTVILATGGMAAPNTGSDGDGYEMLRYIDGHRSEDCFPALTSLIAVTPMPSLKGVRVKPCRVTLFGASDIGEVQFTARGLSGIPVMNVSGAFDASHYGFTGNIYLDLFPELSNEELNALLESRKALGLPLENIYAGLLHKSIAREFAKNKKLDAKNWRIEFYHPLEYETAQVTGGGASLKDFDPRTMRSNIYKNLFAAGEVLDVYGQCGGYNLHWAWVTGILAGRAAVKSIEEGL